MSKIKELEPEKEMPVTPQNRQIARFIQSFPLRHTPTTLAQFAKGSKYLQETLDIKRERKVKIKRLFRGVQVSLTAGFEAMEQVESAAQRQREEVARKTATSKAWQKRGGGVLETAKEGREWVSIKEIKEVGLREMRARKEEEEALLSQRAIREEEEEEEFDIEEETTIYTPYVVPDHVAIFNQRVEEALRLHVLEWS